MFLIYDSKEKHDNLLVYSLTNNIIELKKLLKKYKKEPLPYQKKIINLNNYFDYDIDVDDDGYFYLNESYNNIDYDVDIDDDGYFYLNEIHNNIIYY